MSYCYNHSDCSEIFGHVCKYAQKEPQRTEDEMIVAITDGPIVPENITIDAHYRFTKRIAELERKLKVATEALSDVHSCEDCGSKDIARKALAEIGGGGE